MPSQRSLSSAEHMGFGEVVVVVVVVATVVVVVVTVVVVVVAMVVVVVVAVVVTKLHCNKATENKAQKLMVMELSNRSY